MSQILIDQIRVNGFRGLIDFKMPLKRTTVLTGINNAGKTSVLKAMQLALGSRSFIERDDYHIHENGCVSHEIIIDIRIVSTDTSDNRLKEFSDSWESVFKTHMVQYDINECAYVPFRTKIKYERINERSKIEQFILSTWENTNPAKDWKEITSKKTSFSIEEIMFFYQDAQRDVVDDIKLKTSYLGKMMSQISNSYDHEDLKALEELMKKLNDTAIEKSKILSLIKLALNSISSTMNSGENIDITPFAKRIRDINNNIAITYGGENNSLTMDFHGMGTRSWTSLLSLKAFLEHNENLSTDNGISFFPVIAIEEPEAHLHPNAQKKLYKQLNALPGQKIISTHSQYIAASAEIDEVNVMYKGTSAIYVNCINKSVLSQEDIRKLRQKVIRTKGEVFFSKALILFEGETEEQALPIFAQKHFRCDPSELGIDFVGVGGAGQYLPFIRFAESYNIPWYIFSDGEDAPVRDMTASVQKVRGNSFTSIESEKNIFIIQDGEDFEKYICKSYFNEIRDYYKSKVTGECDNEKKKLALDRTISKWTEDTILEKATKHKTQWAPILADAVSNCDKGLPLLVKELLDKVKIDLGYE